MSKPEHRLAAARRGPRYPGNMNDSRWTGIAPLIPPARPGAAGSPVNLREVLNAIFYVLANRLSIASLAKDFPPKRDFAQFMRRGERIRHAAQISRGISIVSRRGRDMKQIRWPLRGVPQRGIPVEQQYVHRP